MYETKFIKIMWIITSVVCLISGCVLLAGCRTTEPVITSGVVEQYNRSIAELQARNQQFENLFAEFGTDIGNIQRSAANAGSNIDLAIYYFNEYNKRVEQLVADYNRLQRETGQFKEVDN